jgi:DNA polymerase III alpha subunit (gram-positive type)
MMKNEDVKKFRTAYEAISRSLTQSQATNRVLVANAKKLSQQLISYSSEMNKLANLKKENDRMIEKLSDEVSRAWTTTAQAKQQEKSARILTKKLKLEINKMKLEVNEMHREMRTLSRQLEKEKAKNAMFGAKKKKSEEQKESQSRGGRDRRGRGPRQEGSIGALAGGFSGGGNVVQQAAQRSGKKHSGIFQTNSGKPIARSAGGVALGGIWDKAMESRSVLPDQLKHMSHLPTHIGAAKETDTAVQYHRLPVLQEPYKKGHSFGEKSRPGYGGKSRRRQ